MAKAKVKVIDTDRGWKALYLNAKKIKDARVRVGVLSDAKGKEKTEDGDLTLAELAVILHFGTKDKRIPPRPFLTLAFDRHREDLALVGKALMAGVLLGKMDIEKALNIMGSRFAAHTKKTITTGVGVPPPNKPSTLRKKYPKTRPLVVTGRLVGSITWAIDKKKGDGK